MAKMLGWPLTAPVGSGQEGWPGEVLFRKLALVPERPARRSLPGMPVLSRHPASERLQLPGVLPLPVWEPPVSEEVWVFPV